MPKTSATRARAAVPKPEKPSKRVPAYMAFIFGRGGVGKTSMFETLKPMGRGLVIDTPQYEGGTEVIAQARDFIDVRKVRKWADVEVLYHALRKGKATFEDSGEPYQWVGIDTATGIQKVARRKVKADEKDDEMRKAVGSQYRVTLQNFGSIGDLMAIFFEDWRMLGLPLIIMAQEREREDEETGETIIQPDLTPQTLRELVPHPKLIARLFVERNGKGRWERRLRVVYDPTKSTKSRSIKGRRLPDTIKNPDLGQILAYMQGEKVEKPKAAKETSQASGDLELA